MTRTLIIIADDKHHFTHYYGNGVNSLGGSLLEELQMFSKKHRDKLEEYCKRIGMGSMNTHYVTETGMLNLVTVLSDIDYLYIVEVYESVVEVIYCLVETAEAAEMLFESN